ncbi:Tyrosine-protein kinase transforming protein SEA [Geodia barretti]|uniref:Tyrosine-protein kinase transforming protein SEA n=1 Tax=Geodia barretti TaxID=519541 RepID=A0AA35RSP1_GEOBA|nr:Tyrosine-protein kinase transforming protein SEA [Geodia barretti]
MAMLATRVDEMSQNSEESVTVYIAVSVVLASLTSIAIIVSVITIYCKQRHQRNNGSSHTEADGDDHCYIESGKGRMNEELSDLMQRMSELKLLVPEGCISTQKIVGEETSSMLLSTCLQISRGMQYLAERKFIHRDLAARNCMIDLNNVIKVADFGLSEKIYSSKSYFRIEVAGQGGVKLPVKWMAIESLNDDIFSEKTDVWSFGVTCWEVFTLGKGPYPGVDPFSLLRHLERGERLVKPANVACSEEM